MAGFAARPVSVSGSADGPGGQDAYGSGAPGAVGSSTQAGGAFGLGGGVGRTRGGSRWAPSPCAASAGPVQGSRPGSSAPPPGGPASHHGCASAAGDAPGDPKDPLPAQGAAGRPGPSSA